MLRQGAQTGCSVRRLAESRTLLFLAALSGGSDAFPLLHHRTGRLTWTDPQEPVHSLCVTLIERSYLQSFLRLPSYLSKYDYSMAPICY